jgi:hypothetical protein
LEPIWLAYPTGALAILTLLFALSVRWTLKAHPVPDLNYAYEPRYARTYRAPAGPTNYHQVFAASASSASAIGCVGPRRAVEYRRELERLAWLPGVAS